MRTVGGLSYIGDEEIGRQVLKYGMESGETGRLFFRDYSGANGVEFAYSFLADDEVVFVSEKLAKDKFMFLTKWFADRRYGPVVLERHFDFFKESLKEACSGMNLQDEGPLSDKLAYCDLSSNGEVITVQSPDFNRTRMIEPLSQFISSTTFYRATPRELAKSLGVAYKKFRIV